MLLDAGVWEFLGVEPDDLSHLSQTFTAQQDNRIHSAHGRVPEVYNDFIYLNHGKNERLSMSTGAGFLPPTDFFS